MCKEKLYQTVLKQAQSLLVPSDRDLSKISNLCALLKSEFNWHWVGVYLSNKEKNFLHLGPFQGPVACTNIPTSKGVCGDSFTQGKTIIVGNVDLYPGHIACSSFSKSEIVVPLFSEKTKEDSIIGVLDVDSDRLDDFSSVDQKYLELLVGILMESLNNPEEILF
jgi:GAF domain-containing protein